MDSGENIAETCVREVFEETGLPVSIVRLVGVYSSPDWLIEYADGHRVQAVSLCFEVALEDGGPDPQMLAPNSEVDQSGYFTLQEVDALEMMENHHQRIVDAFAEQSHAFIR